MHQQVYIIRLFLEKSEIFGLVTVSNSDALYKVYLSVERE